MFIQIKSSSRLHWLSLRAQDPQYLRNFLVSLSKSIQYCRSLEELNANFNKLFRLADSIGFELTNLSKLSINSNNLIGLPVSIAHPEVPARSRGDLANW
ncbi:hypothetical protein HA466_0236200 [Hirschfeldia incana]|nr:hypothetical protein HA466_0236200 [Hirschfeldia incana]